jgi:hypothetical protein
MSLEEAISNLTAAVRENTAALLASKTAEAPATEAEPAKTNKAAGKPKAAKEAAQAAVVEKAPEPAKDPDGLDEDAQPTLAEVRAAILLVRDKFGKEAAKGIVTLSGGQSIDTIPPENYAAAVLSAQTKLKAAKGE